MRGKHGTSRAASAFSARRRYASAPGALARGRGIERIGGRGRAGCRLSAGRILRTAWNGIGLEVVIARTHGRHVGHLASSGWSAVEPFQEERGFPAIAEPFGLAFVEVYGPTKIPNAFRDADGAPGPATDSYAEGRRRQGTPARTPFPESQTTTRDMGRQSPLLQSSARLGESCGKRWWMDLGRGGELLVFVPITSAARPFL